MNVTGRPPRLPILVGIILFLGAMALTTMVYATLSARNVTGLRGPWVKTHVSEWGTGRGGYFMNEGKADGLVLAIVAGIPALLTGLLVWRRPIVPALRQACIVALVGSWVTLPLLGLWIREELSGHGGPPPPGFVPEPRPDRLMGHLGQVTSVAFSPDGRLLASGGEDRTVRLWQITPPREAATLRGHTAEVLTVAFSPDGKTVASGGNDNLIRLWDVETRTEAAALKGHSNFVRSVAFSPDGAILASASWDKTIKLWDLKTRTELATLEGHTDVVKAVAFSPDGKTLASGSVDRSVRLWDVAGRKTVREMSGLGTYAGQVLSVAFSPDGRWLATASELSGVIVWELSSPSEPARFGPSGKTWGVAFSPDGSRLATCTEEGNAELWNVTGGGIWKPSLSGEVGRFVKGMAEVLFTRSKSFKTPGRIYAVAFSSDGRTVATAGGTGPDGPRVVGSVDSQPSPPSPGALNLWDSR